jgi:hypothetical protein
MQRFARNPQGSERPIVSSPTGIHTNRASQAIQEAARPLAFRSQSAVSNLAFSKRSRNLELRGQAHLPFIVSATPVFGSSLEY